MKRQDLDRKIDLGLLYEYALNISGVTNRLRAEYCQDVAWKDCGWYLTWIVFRYVLRCKTYEEALTYATIETLQKYRLLRFLVHDKKTFLGIGTDVLGEDAAETFEVELSSAKTEDATLWSLKVMLDILYHDVPPQDQIEVALQHPYEGDRFNRRRLTFEETAKRLRACKERLMKPLMVLLLFVLTAVSFLSPAKADGVQLHPDGNVVVEGGINTYDGTEAKTREEAKELEAKLKSLGYVYFQRGYVPDDEYALLTDPDVRCGFRAWLDENRYPTNQCFIYIPGDTYRDAISFLQKGEPLPWYTELELAGATVLVTYVAFDEQDLAGTQSDILNAAVSDDVASYLEITSPISCEVKVIQAYTKRFYLFYVAAGEPYLVRLPYGIYSVSVLNNTSIKASDGYFALEEIHTLESPKRVSLSSIVNKYNIPAADIGGKPNQSLTAKEPFYGDSYQTVIEEPSPTPTPVPSEKSGERGWVRYVFLGIFAFLLFFGCGFYFYVKKRQRG